MEQLEIALKALQPKNNAIVYKKSVNLSSNEIDIFQHLSTRDSNFLFSLPTPQYIDAYYLNKGNNTTLIKKEIIDTDNKYTVTFLNSNNTTFYKFSDKLGNKGSGIIWMWEDKYTRLENTYVDNEWEFTFELDGNYFKEKSLEMSLYKVPHINIKDKNKDSCAVLDIRRKYSQLERFRISKSLEGNFDELTDSVVQNCIIYGLDTITLNNKNIEGPKSYTGYGTTVKYQNTSIIDYSTSAGQAYWGNERIYNNGNKNSILTIGAAGGTQRSTKHITFGKRTFYSEESIFDYGGMFGVNEQKIMIGFEENYIAEKREQKKTDSIANEKKRIANEKKRIFSILSSDELTYTFDQTYGAESISISLKLTPNGTFKYYMKITSNINQSQSKAIHASGNYEVSGSLQTKVKVHLSGQTSSGRYFSLHGILGKYERNKYFFRHDPNSFYPDRVTVNSPVLPYDILYD